MAVGAIDPCHGVRSFDPLGKMPIVLSENFRRSVWRKSRSSFRDLVQPAINRIRKGPVCTRQNGRLMGVLKEERLKERGIVVIVVTSCRFAGVELEALVRFADFESVRMAVCAVIRRYRNGHFVGVLLEVLGMTGDTPDCIDVLEKNSVFRISELRDRVGVVREFEIVRVTGVACFVAHPRAREEALRWLIVMTNVTSLFDLVMSVGGDPREQLAFVFLPEKHPAEVAAQHSGGDEPDRYVQRLWKFDGHQ